MQHSPQIFKPNPLRTAQASASGFRKAAVLTIAASLLQTAISQVTSTDIGSPLPAGSTTQNGATSYTLTVGGTDIASTSDKFRFTYQPLTGDGTIIARVDSIQHTDNWAKAGVMIRESLAANSRHAMMVVTPAQGVSFQRRISTGGGSSATTTAGNAPRWLRVVRAGTLFTGSHSVDGANWTTTGSVNITMGTAVYAGLCVTSHRSGTANTSVFSNVAFPGASGRAEVIVDNPAAVLTGAWTTSTSPTGFHGANYLHDDNSGKGTKTARFSPSLVAGNYKVYLRWVAATTHSVSVPVDVTHGDGLESLSVNQQGGGQWSLLGVYRFNTGSGGNVLISNTGTSGRVIADAVRFEPTAEPNDAVVLASGLSSWRKPDGDGISCASCHGPAGYDVAVFNFNNADLRRATMPHLTDPDADKIFSMIELLRRNYPPVGGLKDPATFRPFQPGNGQIVGGENASNEDRDAAFGNNAVANYLYAQGRLDTVTEARAARDQLLNVNVLSVPVGIKFNHWSESVTRQGVEPGGKFNEWLPAIGQQMGANLAAFQALEDAYIADPSDANFWPMFHKLDAWGISDPHNSAPLTNPLWKGLSRQQLKANFVFQHEELQRTQGVSNWVSGRTTTRPFQDQEGNGSNLAFFWDVADDARVLRLTPLGELPLRDQESVFTSAGSPLRLHIDELRVPWFWLGWSHDHSLFFSGTSNSTRAGEYFIGQMWTEKFRAHQVFFNMVHAVKRGFKPGAWNTGNLGGPVQHFTSKKDYYLGYGNYKQSTDAPGYPGSGARYMNMLANSIRLLALLHQDDIQSKGKVYGVKTVITDHIEVMREALNWADLPNKTQNDQILNSLIATVNATPQG